MPAELARTEHDPDCSQAEISDTPESGCRGGGRTRIGPRGTRRSASRTDGRMEFATSPSACPLQCEPYYSHKYQYIAQCRLIQRAVNSTLLSRCSSQAPFPFPPPYQPADIHAHPSLCGPTLHCHAERAASASASWLRVELCSSSSCMAVLDSSCRSRAAACSSCSSSSATGRPAADSNAVTASTSCSGPTTDCGCCCCCCCGSCCVMTDCCDVPAAAPTNGHAALPAAPAAVSGLLQPPPRSVAAPSAWLPNE
eukprot:72832-Chlamydomonas_euryale.AAC.4